MKPEIEDGPFHEIEVDDETWERMHLMGWLRPHLTWVLTEKGEKELLEGMAYLKEEMNIMFPRPRGGGALGSD